MRLSRAAVDTGDGENTMEIYTWARRHPGFVMAVKGRDVLSMSQPIGAPTWQDVTVRGRKIKKGVRLWNVGTSMLKLELYGQLSLEKPVDGEDYPDGYVFLPDGTGDEWIKQLVAEELRIVKRRTGGFRREWHKVRDRNEALDNAVYARAVAISLGVDRWSAAQWQKIAGHTAAPTPAVAEPGRTQPTSAVVAHDAPSKAAGAPTAERASKRRRPNPFTTRSR